MRRCALILVASLCCVAATRVLRSPKDQANQPVAAPTTLRVVAPAAPLVVVPPRTNAWTHFAVTATGTNGLESEYSKEAVLTNKATIVTLAWDRTTNTPIDHYTLYVGPALTNYSRKVPVGNVTNATIALLPTNFVWTVTTKGATNLAWSNDFKTWNKINATNYCATNGPLRQWWRAYGPSKTTPPTIVPSARLQF